MNCVLPAPGFLETLRTLCDRHGSVLIFDEVMTGFRVALGGAQALYGIKPDLTTLGKIVGGGMPVGAFGGRREIMERIAPLGPVYQAGTLSGNPLAMAAGEATLAGVSAPGFHASLAEKTARLMDGLNAAARAAGVPFTTNHVCGMFGLFFSERPVRSFARRHGVRRGALQALLPRDARRGHLPRAVGVRSRIHFRGALRRRHRRDGRGRAASVRRPVAADGATAPHCRACTCSGTVRRCRGSSGCA